ncbi:MAG: AraC family transcriptional regulator, partial [Polyangiaceae bacterium]
SRERARPTPAVHEIAALSFYTRGTATMEQRGCWTVGPGDVLLIPAGEPHRFLQADALEAWCLGLCVPCFAAEAGATFLDPFDRVRAGASPVFHIPEDRRTFVETLFRELHQASLPPRSSEPLAVQRSLLTLLLHEITRAAAWAPALPESGGVVADSLRFIERNCLGPLTLTEVARAVGRTPAHVTTALTRATGKSAVAWIVAGRMAEARRLLVCSTERVEDIAFRVGYADPTHFIRMFRREHGQTPAAFRTEKLRSP